MNMKLYCSLTSPYSRKVRVIAHELDLHERIEVILTDPFNPSAEFLAANPLARIPTLVTEHGVALPDSKLIAEYLHSRGRGMAPAARGSLRWEPLRRQQIAQGLIDASVAIVLEKRRPESIIFTSFLDRQSAVIHRSLDALNVIGAELSPGAPGDLEVTLGVGLAYLDFRLPYIEWRKTCEPLAQWFAVFAQRPSMQSTQPPV